MMLSLSFTTFTSDGGKSVHALTLNTNMVRVYVATVLALLLMVTLSLVKLYEMVMSVVGFFLTTSPESLLRLFFLMVVTIGIIVFFRYPRRARPC